MEQFCRVITPVSAEWSIIRRLQQTGKLPQFLRNVLVYRIPRQYERNVYELEHWQVLEVGLQMIPLPFSIAPHYRERVLHYTCYNPREGRLHVLLCESSSLEDLEKLLEKESVFTPPLYRQ